MKSKDWLIDMENDLRSKGYTGQYCIIFSPEERDFIGIKMFAFDDNSVPVRSYYGKGDSYYMAACDLANSYYSAPIRK